MLKLFTREENPRAEENVGSVAVNHREEHVVELKSERSEVDNHSTDGIPRIPGFQHESRNLNSHRFVSLVVLLKFCAVTKERKCRPKKNPCENRSDNTDKKSSHLR